ncbi:MAG: putative fatty-acid--CoA ligase [Acidimicrobiales bacterium]|nr:putative fatty-acid--CoA ligase [Acidimicrobiales bacterium]
MVVRGIRNGSPVMIEWRDGVLSGDPPTIDLIEVEAGMAVVGATDPLVARSGGPLVGATRDELLGTATQALAVIRRVVDRVTEVTPAWLGTAPATVADIVRANGVLRGAHQAIVVGEQSCTWAQLDARSSQVAVALEADGIGAGNRVAILEKSSIETFEVLFGCAKLNAVAVSISWRLVARELAVLLNDSRATVLVVGTDFLPLATAVEPLLEFVKTILVIGASDPYPSYAEWRDACSATDPSADSADDDVVLQLYTSGTTGVPKGVMLTNRNLIELVRGAEMLGFEETSINLVPLPLFHIGGCGYALIGMSTGCVTVLVREIDPADMLRIVVEQGVTNMFVAPAVLQLMLGVPGVDTMDFSRLRYIVYGASPVSNDLLGRAVSTLGCRFIQVYGLTETTGTVTVLPPEDHDPTGPNPHRLRSAGRPVEGAAVRIVLAGSDTEAATGEVGEIWVRTPQNMLGYWRKPDETAAVLTEAGWLKTGDAGYVDDDGYLYIHDRVKDMIISGGENVYPAEVENVLMSHPEVAAVAVIGVPSERWGETVKAVVVAVPNADPDPSEIIALAREQLAHYKCPTSVDFVDALPLNAAGKVLKRELRAPYWGDRARAIN